MERPDQPAAQPGPLHQPPAAHPAWELSSLGVPPGVATLTDAQAREAWRTFCAHWHVYRSTPVVWMEAELVEIFGVDVRPSAETADAIYDTIATLAQPDFRPRQLMDRFDIAFMATTDDPCDDLAYHQQLAADPTFPRRVAPTFHPDRYLEPARDGWSGLVDNLAAVSGIETETYDGWVQAMENRRAYFDQRRRLGDHAHADLDTTPRVS